MYRLFKNQRAHFSFTNCYGSRFITNIGVNLNPNKTQLKNYYLWMQILSKGSTIFLLVLFFLKQLANLLLFFAHLYGLRAFAKND